MSETKPIAFYGTLMRDGGAQARLGIADRLRFVGPCRMRGALVDLGAYPGLIEVEQSSGLVEGELFELLDDRILAELDEYEGYDPDDLEGSFYERRTLRLVEPDGEAWVYVYRGDLSKARRVGSGRWSLREDRPEARSDGVCSCGRVRFRLMDEPLIVHACHCRYCQRETGSAFAVNALIESGRFELLAGEPIEVVTASASGKGQVIVRCPDCHVALWSYYAGATRAVRFVRVGTLEDPDRWPPDIHIYTSSKQPWVVLPEGARAVAEFYDIEKVWSKESLARRRLALKERAQDP